MDEQQEASIESFIQITKLSREEAVTWLSAHGWDFETALALYYGDTSDNNNNNNNNNSDNTGPRRLDGEPVPSQSTSRAAAGAPRAAVAAPKKKGIATLSSLGGGGAAHGHDDDDDEDEDWENSGRGDLFAGGEKSGLAVQDPSADNSAKKLIDDIVKKAKANTSRPDSESSAPSASRFRGAARTLGGDGVESRMIPDPLEGLEEPRQPANQEPQTRTLYLWRDGFSIDDGPLHRFDDPENAADLALIRQGRAPLHLMNVSYDQPVDVKLEQRDENWHQLPRIYRPFGGAGRRLGAPTPGDSSSDPATATATATAAAAPAPATTSTATPPAAISVDDSQPVITIRVQLPTGTRLPVRFNTTHTIGDVYGVIRQSSAEMASRQWVVATTFPNKDHTDHSQVLGEMQEFKKGGTAVVKWT
jgi:UBX domain-containing protein 1